MLLRVICVGAALVTATPALGTTALEMASNCNESFAQPVIQGDNVRMLPTYRTGACWGAFEVLKWIIYAVDPDKTPVVHVCPPRGLKQVQLIKVFLAYTSEHPEQLHQEFSLLAMNSLVRAFPCK